MTRSNQNRAMKFVLYAAMSLAVTGAGLAHAELTIWQVENNPPGTDSGNEWLTLINTGEPDTFEGYGVQTTNGRIASYSLPTLSLDMCEYHKITFPKQAIDNEDDTVILHKDGTAVYETPTIRDTKNDDRFWTNPDVAAICANPHSTTHEPATEMTLEQRIEALEAEVNILHQLIQGILEILDGLLNMG